MSIKYSELKKKEVFNVISGENYGKIQDLIIDKKTGKIDKIIVPGKKQGFLSCESLEIKFCDIEKIGTDAILVRFGNCKKDDDCKCVKNPCIERVELCEFDEE